MTERFDARDLANAVDAGILQPGQDHELLAFLRRGARPQEGFQLANVAFYFGGLLIMAAMGWLLTEAWMRIGDWALLAVACSYIAVLTWLALAMQRRQQKVPAGVLAAASVSIVPLAVFAFERLLGWWPQDIWQDDYHPYYTHVNASWLLMEVATVVAGIAMLRLIPFPFVVMPVALALWFMSMDAAAWWYGQTLTWSQREQVSIGFGLALLVVFVVVDGRTRHDYAGWGYLAGLLAFWCGLTSMNSDSELSKALYCLINLLLMGCAVLLRRPVFMAFGALGVASYLGYLSYEVFAESLLFPVVLTVIGLAAIGLGLAYQKRREQLSAAVRARLPGWLVTALPALRD